MMPPGIRPGETPPFHKLGEYVFQDLCRDLFDHEPQIAVCEVYGVRGQSQDGIDLLARRSKGDGIEVGQCKCYEEFSSDKIRTASDEFFKHWDEHWSKDDVRRFILFVACDLSLRQQQDEITVQMKRFSAVGVAYEVWSGAKIRNKLRPHRSIVATYCVPPEHWVLVICCPETPLSPVAVGVETQTSIIVSATLTNQIERLAARASNETDQNLARMRTAWREGKTERVITELTALKNDTAVWPVLSPEIKAKVLLFEAGIELEVTGNIVRVRQLADEALGLAPGENQARLRAVIALRELGHEEALALLEGQNDIDSLNLKANILLQMGRIDECQAIVEFDDSEFESNG